MDAAAEDEDMEAGVPLLQAEWSGPFRGIPWMHENFEMKALQYSSRPLGEQLLWEWKYVNAVTGAKSEQNLGGQAKGATKVSHP
jgi:hypothetical protein